MQFSVTILGSNSALPTSDRNPTAQVLNVSERFFLIDCGEGTQMQLRKYKIRFSKINHIFISHLHGDHYFGLLGLISTYGLLGRTSDLHIYAHKDLERLLTPQLNYFGRELSYQVIFHPIEPSLNTVIYEDSKITVSSIPLDHRIPTCGFLFQEKPADLHILREAIDFFEIPIKMIPSIKKGADFTLPSGEIVENHRLTKKPYKPRSYAFCSDTLYNEKIVPLVKNVDLLYHEATFMNDQKKLAKKTYHTTAEQAGLIAERAGVDRLIIGHFSTRYYDLQPLLEECRSVFPNSDLALDGLTFTIPHKSGV